MGILSKIFEGSDAVANFLLLSSAVKIVLALTGGRRLVGHVSRLVLYPVKSMRGCDVEELDCHTHGAQKGRFGDRHFIVVHGNENTFVTARTEPTLLLVQPQVSSSGILHLVADNMEPLVINLDEVELSNKATDATVHGTPVLGLDCGDAAGSWIDKYLKKTGHRLLFYSPSVTSKRTIKFANVKYQAWTSHVDINDKLAYQDSSSYHILSEASVEDLNSRLNGNSVSADYFRANIIVSGASPFAEDFWKEVSIGEAEFSSVKLCSRCIMTTTDPKTAKRSEEPLVTLRSYRKLVPSFEDSPCLGVNLILQTLGTIRVGDPVYAVISKPRLAP